MKKIITGILILLSVGGCQKTEDGGRRTDQSSPERAVLYYRNPMGLADTSPIPKKDSMGMDYIPVFKDGEEMSDDQHTATTGSGHISISVEKIQKLGVKSEAAIRRKLDKTLRAAGRVEMDERRTYTIAPKFEGWVEKLHISSTGQTVSKGQPLFEVYSPELNGALREYALAVQGEATLKNAADDAQNSMRQLAAASLARLKNWGVADQQINDYLQDRNKRNLTFYAPLSGIVLEKKAVQGMRFMPGEMLYQLADLSSVWVLAEVNEQDIASVKTGGVAQVNLTAYPGKTFTGTVDFIYPTLNAATRTVQVRVELANPQALLKPAMFAEITLLLSDNKKVLAVPISAVIDSGIKQIVLVQLAAGRFEPRAVKLGLHSENYVEVLVGIAEGEQVVTAANFLIDAESNLKAALSGMDGQASNPSPPSP